MNRAKLFLVVLVMALGINTSTFASAQPTNLETPAAVQQTQKSYINVNALDMVARPNFYLNKNVLVKGKFDKFSTLGLDYKPAFRNSEEYISFLIQRDDVKDHNVPLSELKIFMKRTEAEKYIELSAGDEIEFSGKVFSTALGDVWMDAENFKVLCSKSTEKKPADKK